MAAALAGRGLTLQGLLPDVLSLGFGHAGEESEQGGAVPGWVVEALRRAGEQFQLEIGAAQVLGDGQQLSRATGEAFHLVHGKDHPLARDGLLDGAGVLHRLGEFWPYLDPGADLLGEDRFAARLAQGVELAVQFLLGAAAAGIAHPGRLRRDVGGQGFARRAGLPGAAGAAIGGRAHLQLGAQLRRQHEARSVVLRRDVAAAGTAGAARRRLAHRAVEGLDRDGRVGKIARRRTYRAPGSARKVLREVLITKIEDKPDARRRLSGSRRTDHS
nr:hypothetical protein [Spongiactinospora gelatinilytica]